MNWVTRTCNYAEMQVKLKKPDTKTKLTHKWLKSWTQNITSRLNGIGRNEVKILGLHVCLYLQVSPSTSWLRHKILTRETSLFLNLQTWRWRILTSTPSKARLSVTFIFCEVTIDSKSPHTSRTTKCENMDAMLLVLLASLTYMPLY